MKHGVAERLKALALTLAVAAPMAYVMQISTGIWFPFWYTLAFAVLSLVAVELIAWTKWTAIGVPAGILITCLLVWWAFSKEQKQFFSDFYWWAVGFLYEGEKYPVGYGVALTAILSFFVSLLVWLLGRKFFFFPAVFGFVTGFVLFKWLQGMDAVLLPGFLAVAGVMALWIKAFLRKTAKKTKQDHHENGIALFLLPLAFVAVLLSLWFVPKEQAEKWQNQQVYDLLERFNNFLADYTDFDRPRKSFSIGQAGFMPMGNRLGGPITLNDNKVLRVTAGRSMLLRGTVYNEYTGQRWADSTNSQARRFNSTTRDLARDAFDLTRPELSGSEAEQFKRYVSKETMLVYPVTDSYSTLFVPYRGVTEILSSKFLAIRPRFNARGEAFNSSDVRAGYGYTMNFEYLDYESESFGGQMERLLGLSLTDSMAQTTWIQQNFTQLPSGIEQGVLDITESVTDGMGSGWEKAIAIQEYLIKSFNYTLSPSVPPKDGDFVSWFVNHDRRGYCTYYASTMAVMARIAGIPSRYCEGYRMPARAEGGVYEVRQNNAHAWAELYFEGIGWIPFDATPSGSDAAGVPTGIDPGEQPFPTPTRPPFTEDPGDIGELPSRNKLTWQDIAPHLWTVPVALLAAALLWVIWSMARARVRVSLKHVCRKYTDRSRRSAFYYFETLKLLEYYNYPLKTGETPVAYAARIDRWLRLEAGKFQQVAELISRISYSDYEPTDNDVDFLSRFCRDLARYTYHAVGPRFYLVHRVLGFKLRVNRPKSS